MNRKKKTLSLTVAGVLVCLGAAFAVDITGDTIPAGSLAVGVDATTKGLATLHASGSDGGQLTLKGISSGGGAASWHYRNVNSNGHLETNSSYQRKLVIQNVGTAGADVQIPEGDLSVDDGNLNLNGVLVFSDSGTTSDASIAASVGGDVVIQLGD